MGAEQQFEQAAQEQQQQTQGQPYEIKIDYMLKAYQNKIAALMEENVYLAAALEQEKANNK